MRQLFNSMVTTYFISPPLSFCVYLFTPISERNALDNDTIKGYLEGFSEFVDVSRSEQSEFASKFQSFTKFARRKSGTFSLFLFNTLFFIFTLNVIRRRSWVLNSRPTFRSVTKSSQVDSTRSRILLSLVGLLINMLM